MTYCLGIKVKEGLIGLADGRITSGNQLSSARKITMMEVDKCPFFIMSSGLRSVRDKTLAYLRPRLGRASASARCARGPAYHWSEN